MFACCDRRIGRTVERSERATEEAFAGNACQQRLAQLGEFRKPAQQWIVCVVDLAEAEAGIEDDVLRRDARSIAALRRCSSSCFTRGTTSSGARRGRDFHSRAPARVHQDDAALEIRTGGGHGVVPQKAADIVDDLRARLDRRLCSAAW